MVQFNIGARPILPPCACRLDQYLEYVVTYTEDIAYVQAAKADRLFSEVGRRQSICSTGMFLHVDAIDGRNRAVIQRLNGILYPSSECEGSVSKHKYNFLAVLQGTDLGPLQGIPYGLKDLISVEGYRTTWGAPAYIDQMLDTDAYVYKR